MLLQLISLLVALTLATAMVDYNVVDLDDVVLFNVEVLRTVRRYCGPVATVGIFVEIMAVMVAGQSR